MLGWKMFKKRCYICASEEVVRIFTPKRNPKVHHYYCESCAKKYLKDLEGEK